MFGGAGMRLLLNGWGRKTNLQRGDRGLFDESCERAAQARGVEPVGGAVVAPAAVAAQLDVGDAEREQAVRAVASAAATSPPRCPPGRARRARRRRRRHERAQAVGVERAHGREVGDGRVEVARRRQRLVEGRPDRDDDRRVAEPRRSTVSPSARTGAALASSDIRMYTRSSPASARRKRMLELVGVAGHVDGPAGQRRQQRDVAGRLMRAARLRAVVGRAGADEDGADVLVAEVELDLLVGPLDEERRVRVRDRPLALEREARRRRRSSAARGCRR